MNHGSTDKIIQGVISLIKYRNSLKLLIFLFFFIAYWAFYPLMYNKFETAYAIIAALFILIASYLWGIKGGLLSVAATAIIRYTLTKYLKVDFLGGLFAPIVAVTSAVLIGSMSDYIVILEAKLKQIEKNRDEHNLILFPHKVRQSAIYEIILLSILALVIGVISAYYDFFESFYFYSRKLEKYDFDEILIICGILAFFFGIFSYRRWQELKREFRHRLKMEDVLKESEKKYRTIIDHAFEGICIFQGGITRFVNPYVIKTIGYTEMELMNQPFIDFIHPDDQQIVLERHFDRMSGETIPQNYVFRVISKDRSTMWVRVTGQPMNWNNEPAVLVFLRDETEIITAQQMLKNALKEKDTLLREVHHRVKNNMQVIISLLNLQSSEVAKEELKTAFEEAQNRVRAMSLAHEIIYQTESLSAIDLSSYLDTLCRNLLATHNPRSLSIKFSIDIPGVFMELSQAVPCGLLVNELVTNSLKHGFKNRTEGRIDISAQNKENGWIELVISDNGAGLPDNFDWKTSRTLGLRMVKILVEVQLKGKLDFLKKTGACFVIQFRLKLKHEVFNGDGKI